MPAPGNGVIPIIGKPEPWTIVLQTNEGPKTAAVVVVSSFSDSAQLQMAGLVAQVVEQTVERVLAAREAKATVPAPTAEPAPEAQT